jgi:hypothetical protein
MSSDVRKIVYVTLIGFLLMLLSFCGLLFVLACNGTIACNQGQPLTAVRTPIPTLIPAAMPVPQDASGPVVIKCQVYAFDLLEAWFAAGRPETDVFEVTDLNGAVCDASFAADIQPLFSSPNLWYQGAPACTTCHYADLAASQKNMDLSSYAGLMAGAERTGPDVQGKDILGGGDWKASMLYERLTVPAGGTVIAMPLGRLDGIDLTRAIIFAGAARPAPNAP